MSRRQRTPAADSAAAAACGVGVGGGRGAVAHQHVRRRQAFADGQAAGPAFQHQRVQDLSSAAVSHQVKGGGGGAL